MRSKIIAAIVAVASLSPAAGLALPFSPTPQGLAAHLNGVNWNDGKPRVFSGLRDCYYNAGAGIYGCYYGYVKVTDPVRGSVLCEIQKRDGSGWAVTYLDGNKYANNYLLGPTYPCRQL